MHEPGPLLASGRDADIFEYGPGLVLRRSRRQHSIAAEAKVMDFVRARGYPVPAVHEVSDDGLDIVMERIEGESMVDALGAKPWTVHAAADMLADLHLRLHQIEAPPWLDAAPCAPGDRVIHLDLHPLNVMMAKSGPVVIDWSNAARGHPATDVVLTWLLTECGEVDTGPVMRVLIRTLRQILTRRFLGHFERATLTPHLAAVVAWKATDPNMSAAECDAMRALASTHR